MPYIKSDHRKDLEPELSALVSKLKHQSEGTINYVFTTIAKEWCENPSYITLNAMLGIFEAAKQEFYRRVVVPYEDKKIIENGDVY